MSCSPPLVPSLRALNLCPERSVVNPKLLLRFVIAQFRLGLSLTHEASCHISRLHSLSMRQSVGLTGQAYIDFLCLRLRLRVPIRRVGTKEDLPARIRSLVDRVLDDDQDPADPLRELEQTLRTGGEEAVSAFWDCTGACKALFGHLQSHASLVEPVLTLTVQHWGSDYFFASLLPELAECLTRPRLTEQVLAACIGIMQALARVQPVLLLSQHGLIAVRGRDPLLLLLLRALRRIPSPAMLHRCMQLVLQALHESSSSAWAWPIPSVAAVLRPLLGELVGFALDTEKQHAAALGQEAAEWLNARGQALLLIFSLDDQVRKSHPLLDRAVVDRMVDEFGRLTVRACVHRAAPASCCCSSPDLPPLAPLARERERRPGPQTSARARSSTASRGTLQSRWPC